jgi:hypothetical protein
MTLTARTLWQLAEQAAGAIGVPVDDDLGGVVSALRDAGASIRFDSSADCWRATLPTVERAA